MDLITPTTALVIAFTGSTSNHNNLVRAAMRESLGEPPTVLSVSGSGAEKISVRDLGRPLTPDDLKAIADRIAEKSKCSYQGSAPARAINTTEMTFGCPRR